VKLSPVPKRRESRYPPDPEASGPKGEQDKGESGTSC